MGSAGDGVVMGAVPTAPNHRVRDWCCGPVGGGYEVVAPPKAVVPLGVPRPVGPSYPPPAVQR